MIDPSETQLVVMNPTGDDAHAEYYLSEIKSQPGKLRICPITPPRPINDKVVMHV